jgi:hypothetical protein
VATSIRVPADGWPTRSVLSQPGTDKNNPGLVATLAQSGPAGARSQPAWHWFVPDVHRQTIRTMFGDLGANGETS